MPERLADAGWLRAEPLASVLAALNGNGVETRVVGGAVRNALMGADQPHDIDLATTAAPQEVVARAETAGMKAVPTGLDHGTVTVVADGRPFEVTTLRHDVETHGRHATVAFGADWEADARRRDFTMNALYADAAGLVYDPVGGRDDVAARRVRFIGEATERIREDYLRILRFFRFHAQYGHGAPDADGLSAVIAERNGLRHLSGERLRQELLRLLVADGAARTVEVMADSGILPILLAGVAYWPSLARLAKLDRSLDTAPDPVLRLAALAVVIPEDGARLGARLRLSNTECDSLVAVGRRWRDLSPRLNEPDRKRILYQIGPDAWRDAARLAWARAGAPADDAGWRGLVALPEHWQPPAFPLRGADLLKLGMAKGPAVGRLLGELEAQWIAGDFTLSRDALLNEARDRLGNA